jgi:cell division septation protein DedD
MATLTPEEVGRLVRRIGELSKTAEGTLINQAALKDRLDSATAGVMTAAGDFDEPAWQNLPSAEQAQRETVLTNLSRMLGTLPDSGEIALPPSSIMYKQHASNTAVLLLTAFALLGLLGDLYLIRKEWDRATSGKTVIRLSPDETSPAATEKSETQLDASAMESPTPTSDATVDATPPPGPAASGTPASTTTSRSTPTQKVMGPNKPTEQTVLYMVILLGALGGFLHLASSMANYVGNRQLLKSWIIYYVLIPFQGAALAPVIYLLLRVGVLNPANPEQGSESPTDSLNLIGIYAFAALTGLFSKQAIETLADVFATIFKKVQAKDSLDKPPDPRKES